MTDPDDLPLKKQSGIPTTKWARTMLARPGWAAWHLVNKVMREYESAEYGPVSSVQTACGRYLDTARVITIEGKAKGGITCLHCTWKYQDMLAAVGESE